MAVVADEIGDTQSAQTARAFCKIALEKWLSGQEWGSDSLVHDTAWGELLA